MYEYACRACGNEFEARQKISDDPIKTCPKCGKDAVERLVSRSSFALKGAGWYSDGYGAKDSKPKSEASKSDAPKAEKSEKPEKAEKSAKAEAPAAPKTETKAKDGGD